MNCVFNGDQLICLLYTIQILSIFISRAIPSRASNQYDKLMITGGFILGKDSGD